MKKNYVFIVLFLFLQNCGYSPILSDYKGQNFKFNIIEINGDDELNNIIKLNINKLSNNSYNKIYDVKKVYPSIYLVSELSRNKL